MQAKEVKYLMLDHGGVLDGDVSTELAGEEDLLVYEISDGMYQILKEGLKIIDQLNILVDKYGYQIVLHSKNKKEEQIELLEKLNNACSLKGLRFPKVTAMAVVINYYIKV